MSRQIKKILVANRGEITLRIMRTIREMGRQSVAIYSDVDIAMPFVRYADEAYSLEGKEARETYLDIPKIISIARKAKVDAIHPGYGFLSENSEFAREVGKAGIIFIGPRADVIKSMGDKTEARKLVSGYGVPVVPGTPNSIDDLREAKEAARKIGYPILVKAAAGGGGKGMRLVKEESELESSLRGAQSEALSAFGDNRIFIEKYIVNPRHIEFQILADNYGNVVHLFERECSIQRRHQKVVEETPSMALTPELREEMGDAAINAAKACGYSNAGTVEFILGEDGKYYFLEMNTRLQVEHPITEATTGIDIVRKQIKIAEGNKLDFSQKEITRRGHSIESRIYAEDVFNGFLPDTGTLKMLREPVGNGVRVDSGVESGSEISVYYDSMIAKLSVWDTSREHAIKKMLRALDEYVIVGVKTTIPFCKFVLESDDFRGGKYSTHFVEKHWNAEGLKINNFANDGLDAAVIVAASRLKKKSNKQNSTERSEKIKSNWRDGRFES
ncbi:MAG: acetyl-CoA carboxylase biotin carboxylase subunit [Bacteroidetes bacterium]|nr:acetyl-CoA carboxylase biotin carboxylase subunit [Bacteroidota bacterium]MCL5737370.1 acetyl-CoA carboxylase biotin carboxylase subunit [Bacteroidota bacterium]